VAAHALGALMFYMSLSPDLPFADAAQIVSSMLVFHLRFSIFIIALIFWNYERRLKKAAKDLRRFEEREAAEIEAARFVREILGDQTSN
jgi:cbb3-type cytochrome oxidase subunit 3